MIPDELDDTMKRLICGRGSLQGSIHWLRLFYGAPGGSLQIFEVLFDNEQWVEAESKLRKLQWQVSQNYFSIRCFMVLQREDAERTMWSNFTAPVTI